MRGQGHVRLVPGGAGRQQQEAARALQPELSAERFRRIVLPHLADGLALARWLAGNPADAEDIVQEACLRALGATEGFRGGSAKAWVLAIVRNTAFTWLARHRSKALVMVGDLADIDDATAGRAEAASEAAPSPEAELIRRADARRVEAAIAALPLPFREPVVLRDINGLTYREIAQLLELPVGTVMSRLSRGRQHLAQLLGTPEP